MKVLLTTDCFWPRVNGVTVAVQTLMSELQSLGHEVRLIAPEYRLGSSLSPKDPPNVFRVAARPSRVSPEDWLATKEGRKKAEELILEFMPDIIHSHTEFSLSKVAYRCAQKLKRPFVMTSHTFFEQYISHYIPLFAGVIGYWVSRYLTYNKFKRADLIITPGKEMVKTLRGYGLKKQIISIPTGIDHNLYKNYPTQRKLNKYPILLYVGRVAQEKNVFFLLDVLEEVLKQVPTSQLLIIGGGPSEQEFIKTSQKKGIHNHIQMLGYLPREKVIEYYHKVDVFTFPSMTETQGLVSIEAQMAGTPVVAIGVRGSAEVLQDGEGAFLTKFEVKAFSQKVLDLIQSETLWNTMSQKARAYSMNWTSTVLAQKVVQIYQQLLTEITQTSSP